MNQSILGAGYTYDNNILYDAIKTNSVNNYVVARQKEFSSFMSIVYELNGNKGTSVRTDARDFKMPYIKSITPNGIIKTGGRTVQSSTILKLFLTDEAFDGFLVGRILKASNGSFGQIVAHEPGAVTIKLYFSVSGSTTFQAADFAEGTRVVEGADVSKGVSGGKESRKYVPNYEQNVIGSEVYTYEVTREDMSRATVVTTGNGEYWQHGGWDLFMQNEVTHSKEWGDWDNPYVNRQDEWKGGGFKWQVANQGGMLDTYNGTLDEYKLMEIAELIKSRGNGTKEMYVRCGSALLAGLQLTTGSKYIQYAGIDNTIGGTAIRGINMHKWTCLDIDFKFDVWSALDNEEQNPEGRSSINGKLKSSLSGMFFDTSPVQTIGHGLKPFVTPYYYGPDASLTSIVKGRTDLLGREVKEASNDINACRVIIERNELLQLNDPSRHLYLTVSA